MKIEPMLVAVVLAAPSLAHALASIQVRGIGTSEWWSDNTLGLELAQRQAVVRAENRCNEICRGTKGFVRPAPLKLNSRGTIALTAAVQSLKYSVPSPVTRSACCAEPTDPCDYLRILVREYQLPRWPLLGSMAP